jgi:hypothetical protein
MMQGYKLVYPINQTLYPPPTATKTLIRSSEATSMAAANRLSSLPDKLLQRILFFTPPKQAASTSVLSRRWCGLWLRGGALNLDSRHYDRMVDHSDHYDAFLRGAKAALDAFDRGGAGGPVLRKLTLYKDRHCYCYRGIMSVVFTHPAAARLEELRMDCKESTMYLDAMQLAALSCAATLRVLEISYCDINMAPSTGAARRAFPRLTSLVLCNCVLSEGNLHDVRKLTRPKINLIIQVSMYRNSDLLVVNTNNTSTTQIEIRSQKTTQMR